MEQLMTPQDVADYLGIPLATLYRWRHHGTAPKASKVGRHLRFRESDVAEWLETNAS
jgi:excisionase family DNA binding protein